MLEVHESFKTCLESCERKLCPASTDEGVRALLKESHGEVARCVRDVLVQHQLKPWDVKKTLQQVWRDLDVVVPLPPLPDREPVVSLPQTIEDDAAAEHDTTCVFTWYFLQCGHDVWSILKASVLLQGCFS